MSAKKLPPNKVAGWKGYTLDEMRYHRAYLTAKLQIQKEVLAKDAATLKKHWFNPFSGSFLGHAGTLMDYAGYGLAAYNLFRQAKSLMGRKK